MGDTSSVSKFRLKKQLALLSEEKSSDISTFLVSCYKPAGISVDHNKIVWFCGALADEDRKELTKFLKGLPSCEPNHNGIFVFVGKSKSGMILRYFKTPEGGSNVPSYKRDCLFDKEMLTLASQSGLKPAPVIMVDGESMCTFVLGADALKDRMTTVYQGIVSKSYQFDLLKKKLSCIKEPERNKVLLGVHTSMEWIVKSAQELLNSYKKVEIHPVPNTTQGSLENLLSSARRSFAEYDLVGELTVLRDVFGAHQHRIVRGIIDSLEALQSFSLSVLLVHKELEVEVSIRNGLATLRNQEGAQAEDDHTDIFEWLVDKALTFKCAVFVVQENLLQHEQLRGVGGMAGLKRF